MKPKLMPKLGYQETKDPPDQIILYIWALLNFIPIHIWT